LQVPVICSGFRNEFFREIKRHLRNLKLEDQVRFLGFVTPLELQCLYTLSLCMVFPSKFEGFGLPITEAQLVGTPVACSRATSLPDLAGEGALYFDPDIPREIAEALQRLWTDEPLRKTLAKRGMERVAQFSWDRTARMFRAHYRRLAGRPLKDEDRGLIEAPPLL
jgi:glycosyltransferase involved in cell wall biosynthesis